MPALLPLGHHSCVQAQGVLFPFGLCEPWSSLCGSSMGKKPPRKHSKTKDKKKSKKCRESSSSSSETQDMELVSSAAAFGLMHACIRRANVVAQTVF